MWNTLTNAWELLSQVHPRFVLMALSLYILSFFLVGARWRLMVQGLGKQVRLWDTTLCNLGSIFINNVMPATRLGGEAFRIALIHGRNRLSLKIATASSLWDRAAEVPVFLVLVGMSIPTLRKMVANLDGYLLGVILILLIVALGLFIYTRFPRLRSHALKLWERFSSFRMPPKLFLGGVGYAALVWLQDLARLMIVAAAFGVTLSPSQAATLAVFTILAGLVPTVGGLGAVEGGLMGGLVLFGVDADQALAITALERSISYVFGTAVGGVASVALGGRKLWKLTRSQL